MHRLWLFTDGGSEFPIAGGSDFGDHMYEKLAAASPPLEKDTR